MRADPGGTALGADRRPLPGPARAGVHRPPGADVAVLTVAVLAVSTSGPLIAACAAPALAIAFWRNAMASGVLLPWALLRHRGELRRLDARECGLALLAGAALAGHFATWVPSLSYTSVASATALVATQPIWAALIARSRGHHIPVNAWGGILLAVLGAVLLSGVDFAADRRALVGDGLALVGGLLAAVYMATGSEVRRSVSTTTYTTVCYTTAAALLLGCCGVAGASLTGYSARTWWQLAALTAGAQLLGHSLINRVLRTSSATVVSLSILFEIPGAALIAAVFLAQRPPAAAIPAALLLVAGVALVVGRGDRTEPSPPAAPVE